MTHPTDSTTTFLMLQDGTVVSKDFHARIKKHVLDQLSTMRPGKPKELKLICCPEFWGNLSIGERLIAGICVSNMVAHSEMPLITVPHTHEYPKKYCRV